MPKTPAKRILQIGLIVASIASLFFVPWVLVKAWILPLPETVQGQAKQSIEHGFEGIIVYVDKVGEAPNWYTAGWHNKEEKIPAQPNALFKIASISKLYTAVAITQLVHEGKLSLDNTIANYLPKHAAKIEHSDEITLRLMVQHRSGLPNYTDTPNYWADPKETKEEKLALVLNQPADFPPDKKYAYCNTNYLLLRMIMDRVLGYNHVEYMRENILNPLNLNNTYFSLEDVNLDEVMSGYHVGHPHDLKSDNLGMLATAADVGTFVRALNTGGLLSPEEQKTYTSIYEFKHSGWQPGYQSFAEYHPDIDAVIVQFNNTTDPDLLLWNVAEITYNRIVKIVHNHTE